MIQVHAMTISLWFIALVIAAGSARAWTPLGLLNFMVLQWFGVRLARRRWREFGDHGVRHCQGWLVLRWAVPLTGWWFSYRWIGKPPVR